MKKIITSLGVILFMVPLFAQSSTSIAVVTTGKDVDCSVLHVIEDDFQEKLLNASEAKYDIRIGNSDEFFKERNAELEFQASGVVDESMVKEYGKMMGVDQMCVIVVEKRKNDYYLRAKIYDVQSGQLRYTASYPDALERDEPIMDTNNYLVLQRANMLLIHRFNILDSLKQESLWTKIQDIKSDKNKKCNRSRK